MNDIEFVPYEFSNLPLTAAIAQKLIMQLFGNNQVARREDIASAILTRHLKLGGLRPTQTPQQIAKKALTTLKDAGLAVNPSFGFWKILSSEWVNDEEANAAASDIESEEDVQDLADATWQAERTIGTGAQAVYLYFLPAYRDVAMQKQQPNWRCKIGMTTRDDPRDRIYSQASTALPERPVIGLVIRTDMALALEKAIHGILNVRNRGIPDLPGSEWFMTSPDEVEALYIQILGE
jgi:hypothetical protein